MVVALSNFDISFFLLWELGVCLHMLLDYMTRRLMGVANYYRTVSLQGSIILLGKQPFINFETQSYHLTWGWPGDGNFVMYKHDLKVELFDCLTHAIQDARF